VRSIDAQANKLGKPVQRFTEQESNVQGPTLFTHSTVFSPTSYCINDWKYQYIVVKHTPRSSPDWTSSSCVNHLPDRRTLCLLSSPALSSTCKAKAINSTKIRRIDIISSIRNLKI